MPRWFAFAALCFLVGCATPMPKDTPVVDAPDVLGDLPAQYVGTLPCADCDGIALWLTLGPRASYVLQQRAIGAELDQGAVGDLGEAEPRHRANHPAPPPVCIRLLLPGLVSPVPSAQSGHSPFSQVATSTSANAMSSIPRSS